MLLAQRSWQVRRACVQAAAAALHRVVDGRLLQEAEAAVAGAREQVHAVVDARVSFTCKRVARLVTNLRPNAHQRAFKSRRQLSRDGLSMNLCAS